MLIGINWIAPSQLPTIQKLLDRGLIDFCEIMVDNFAHLHPDSIKKHLSNTPVALHFVASRFLEKPVEELHALSDSLRPWIAEFNPLYVSDHIVQFTRNETRLPLIREVEYTNTFEEILKRLLLWQKLLETRVLFENHASISNAGKNQANFFLSLLEQADIHLLFDFSNAFIAQYNQVVPFHAWHALIKKTKHFHVAGFTIEKNTYRAIDTHDKPLSDEVLEIMQQYFLHTLSNPHTTVLLEFDVKTTFEVLQRELLRLKHVVTEKTNSLKSIKSMKRSFCRLRTQDDYALTCLSKQSIRYRIFHYAPKLFNLCQSIGDFVDDFLHHLGEENLSLNWNLHIHLINWLDHQLQFRQHIDTEIVKECLIAAATCWSLTGLDHITVKGILLTIKILPEMAVGLWKNQEASAPNKIVVLQLAQQVQPKQDSYAISYQHGCWDGVAWQVL